MTEEKLAKNRKKVVVSFSYKSMKKQRKCLKEEIFKNKERQSITTNVI